MGFRVSVLLKMSWSGGIKTHLLFYDFFCMCNARRQLKLLSLLKLKPSAAKSTRTLQSLPHPHLNPHLQPRLLRNLNSTPPRTSHQIGAHLSIPVFSHPNCLRHLGVQRRRHRRGCGRRRWKALDCSEGQPGELGKGRRREAVCADGSHT